MLKTCCDARVFQAKKFDWTQGRWPKKSAEFLLHMLKNAESNAELKVYIFTSYQSSFTECLHEVGSVLVVSVSLQLWSCKDQTLSLWQRWVRVTNSLLTIGCNDDNLGHLWITHENTHKT